MTARESIRKRGTAVMCMMKPSFLVIGEKNVLAFIQVATTICVEDFFRRLPTFKMERARLLMCGSV
jgi:hypothetical protein